MSHAELRKSCSERNGLLYDVTYGEYLETKIFNDGSGISKIISPHFSKYVNFKYKE